MTKFKGLFILFLFLNNTSLVSAQNTSALQLSIEDMFELADSASRSIRTFHIAEQEAEQAVKVAKNALLPSIDVSLSASYLGDAWLSDRDFSNGENAPMPHFGNNFAIEASQVLYTGGAITNRIAVAKLQQQLAQLDKEKNKQDIRFLLVGNYLEMYKLRNQTEVYRKNIEQTRKLVADIHAKQSQGLALKNDITRYELQLKSLELALTQIQNSIIILNDQLITVLGLPGETVIEVDSTAHAILPVISNETEWQETAATLSPVLRQAKLNIKQSRHNEKIAKAERLPLPQIGNNLIINIKDTSVLSIISIVDLFFVHKSVAGALYTYFESATIVMAIYLTMTLVTSRLLLLVEKKMDGDANYELVDTMDIGNQLRTIRENDGEGRRG